MNNHLIIWPRLLGNIESETVRALIFEARTLSHRLNHLETLDPKAAKMVRAHLYGRIDEAPIRDMLRGFGRGTKRAVGGTMKAANAVNQRINQLGSLLQNTRPVQNFDQRFEQIKAQLTQKFPNMAATVGKYGEFASTHPKTQAFIIGVMTAAASVTTGPAGGAIVAGMLRASNELLKGEKASTAIGRTVKTAALGWLAGIGIHELGTAIAHAAVPFPTNFQTTLEKMAHVQWTWTINGRTLVNVHGIIPPEIGQRLSKIFEMMTAAHSAGDEDKAAKLYQVFIEFTNNAFDPNGDIQQAIIQQTANDIGVRDLLRKQATEFASTMATVAKYVTAGVQGVIAGKTSQPAQQASAAAPGQQAAARPQYKPGNTQLWQQVLATAKRRGAMNDPNIEQKLANFYKSLGGNWVAA